LRLELAATCPRVIELPLGCDCYQVDVADLISSSRRERAKKHSAKPAVQIESDGDAASDKWITRDIVKVECGFADAAHSAMHLAEPYAVLVVGDASVADRFPALEPIGPDVLEAYAQELRDRGMVPEVETAYGELRRVLRRVASGP
jgi:hypothetical protein